MKTRIALPCLTVLLSLVLLLSVGCRSTSVPPSNGETHETTAEPETTVTTQIDYKPVYDTVDYITDEEKEAWRPYLIRRLTYVQGFNNEDLPEGEYAVGAHTVYALFDVDLDGVPELLGGCLNVGSGFATCYPYAFYAAYDLYTGRELDTKNFMISNNTSVYYDAEQGVYKVYSVDYETSSYNAAHAATGTFVIDRVEVLYDCDTWFPADDFPTEKDIPYLVTTAYLHTSISSKGMYSEETVDDGYDSNRFTTVYSDPSYILDGKPCEYSDYYVALLNFMNTHISIRDTQLQYVYTFYDSIEDFSELVSEQAEAHADQLLSNGQKFVRPIVREEATTPEETE